MLRVPGEPKYWRFGGLKIKEDDCSFIWKIPAERRCQFVRDTEDCQVQSILAYADLLFCGFGTESQILFAIGLTLLFIWLLYLFLILGSTADNFFCPSLAVIASALRMSENIAGVTILAFGNGAPDIFTSLVVSEDERLIMFTELLGAGVFVTAIIAGSVVAISPFRIQAKYYVRDVCFYIFATSWIYFVVMDETVNVYEAFSCILIYVVFIIVVVIMQKLDSMYERQRNRIPPFTDSEVLQAFLENRRVDAPPQLPKRATPFGMQAKLDVAIARELGFDPKTQAPSPSSFKSNRPRSLLKEFFYDISPIHRDDWSSSNTLLKVLLVLRAPFMCVLQLFVPVVNETAEKRGWSKLLNCFQLWLTPIVAMLVLNLQSVRLLGIPVILLVFAATSFVACKVYSKTALDRVPKYHNGFAFLGFLTAMLVVYAVAGEAMAVLECIGFASGISDPMLGITLLSWGNSVGDLISNVAIARKGFPRMGFSACFGGPMFNTLMSIGLTFGIAAARSPNNYIHIRTGDLSIGCFVFLLSSLSAGLVYLSLTGFVARRSFGYLLFTIYAVFMLINFLSEIHFIHPLGVDHRPDEELPG